MSFNPTDMGTRRKKDVGLYTKTPSLTRLGEQGQRSEEFRVLLNVIHGIGIPSQPLSGAQLRQTLGVERRIDQKSTIQTHTADQHDEQHAGDRFMASFLGNKLKLTRTYV
jgi:hypothetical protein